MEHEKSNNMNDEKTVKMENNTFKIEEEANELLLTGNVKDALGKYKSIGINTDLLNAFEAQRNKVKISEITALQLKNQMSNLQTKHGNGSDIPMRYVEQTIQKELNMEDNRKALFGEVVTIRQVYMELYGAPFYSRSQILFDKSYSVLHKLAVKYDAERNVDKSTLMGKELVKNCKKVIELSAEKCEELEETLKKANTQ
ncbi:MAG: hypothetical protein ACI9UJ_001357, partial [bacterium]